MPKRGPKPGFKRGAAVVAPIPVLGEVVAAAEPESQPAVAPAPVPAPLPAPKAAPKPAAPRVKPAAPRVKPVAAPAPVAEAQPAPKVHKDPLQRSREIKTMPHDELKVYAKQLGVAQRDIDGLTHDKLRQNCMLTVDSLLSALLD